MEKELTTEQVTRFLKKSVQNLNETTHGNWFFRLKNKNIVILARETSFGSVEYSSSDYLLTETSAYFGNPRLVNYLFDGEENLKNAYAAFLCELNKGINDSL